MTVILDLSKHEKIPKVIHVTWKTKDILNDQSPIILNGIVNLIKINPEYRVEISDDRDVEKYLKKNLGKWEYFKIQNKKIVEKIDLWRLFKMYNEGGIYLDIDRFCNVSFKDIIHDDTKCVLPTSGDVDFSQDLMISCSHNPIFKKAIQLNLKKRFLINPRGVFHLGPPVYMQAVTEVVFGERIKRYPGESIMKTLRRSLINSEHFQTFKENLPNESLIFKYDQNTFINGNGMTKEQFYKSQSISHWSSGVDKNTVILVFILITISILVIISSL